MRFLNLYFHLYCILILTAFSQASLTDLPRNYDGCPDTSGIVGICMIDAARNCFTQEQCQQGYKCCPYGCGSECLAVTVHSHHPGSCPTEDITTGKACRMDTVCKTNEKCCHGHCVAVRNFRAPVLSIIG